MGQFQSKEYDGDPYVDLMRALPERELIWWVQKVIWVSVCWQQQQQQQCMSAAAVQHQAAAALAVQPETPYYHQHVICLLLDRSQHSWGLSFRECSCWHLAAIDSTDVH
jgi:hypothetical protein